MWKPLVFALGFLTRLRLPGQGATISGHADLVRSLMAFPVVGLFVGTVQAALGWSLGFCFSSELSAWWVVGLGAWLTRGLHLDGLADVADGMGGAYDPERRLAIMKDSRVGSFGVLALIMGVGLKVFSVSGLLAAHCWSAILLVPALSRYAMVLSMHKAVYARAEGGLGKAFVEGLGRHEVFWASVWAVLIAMALVQLWAVLMLAVATASAMVLRSAAKRWLGGMTGDMLGAVNEVTEILLYHAALVIAKGVGS